ncbi:hypothetical protein HPB47_011994 [Ixodes persulcatus]|uniref:Uncharacterized protein n=1 Tax=Ixodes persulcatus TaxID=34615 RepID=A0AC60NUR6_IXOPE|nr:hypothetical protein HPB47_011994 [Ixodes persulcatus]
MLPPISPTPTISSPGSLYPGGKGPTSRTKVANIPRPDLDKYQATIRPRARFDVSKLPSYLIGEQLQRTIGETVLEDRLAYRRNGMTNTISVTVYDERHLASLLQLTHLETGSGRVDVEVYRTATREFPRGVVHLTPDIPPSKLLEGLRADYHEIVQARPLGSNGTYLLTFQGQGVPRRIRAWHEIIQVEPYRPSTVVCNNCHGLGHKSDICTQEKRCQSCDGLLTEGHRCETVKCRNCGSQDHVATSRDCPERKKLDSRIQARARPRPALNQQQQRRRTAVGNQGQAPDPPPQQPQSGRQAQTPHAGDGQAPPSPKQTKNPSPRSTENIIDQPAPPQDTYAHKATPRNCRTPSTTPLMDQRNERLALFKRYKEEEAEHARIAADRRRKVATLQKRIEELEVNFQPCPQHQVSSQSQAHPSPPSPPREVPQSRANHPASPPASNKQPQQQQSQPPPSHDDLKSQMQPSSNTHPLPPPRRHRRSFNYVSPSSPLMSLDNKPGNKGDPRSSHTYNPRNQQAQGPGEFIPSLASPLVPTQLRILQWNCRSLTKHKNEFQLRLAQHRHPYDAILMQETNNYFHNPAIEREYTKTGPPEARGLATVYIKRTLPHAQIDTQKWCTPDQEVTAVRTLMDNDKLFLVSAYVRPTAEDPNLSWLEELRMAYPDDRMVIGGDFNAHHREWGYDDDDKRGARLLEAYEKADLELANDTHENARVGTSANQQDTNPDLTLVDSRIEGMEWSVFPDAWGSDHYPIEISIRIKNRAKAKKTVVTVLWDKFRALLRAHIDENDMSTTICALLVASTKEASTKKEVNWDCPTPDTHLLSLWDHRTRKLTEYRNTKGRNTLKLVNRITAEAEDYTRKLRVNEWLDNCASFD